MSEEEQRSLALYRQEILYALEPADVVTDRLLASGVITPSLRSSISLRHRDERAEWLVS